MIYRLDQLDEKMQEKYRLTDKEWELIKEYSYYDELMFEFRKNNQDSCANKDYMDTLHKWSPLRNRLKKNIVVREALFLEDDWVEVGHLPATGELQGKVFYPIIRRIK